MTTMGETHRNEQEHNTVTMRETHRNLAQLQEPLNGEIEFQR